MSNAVTALPLGIALEKFTHLKEEHHKDRFRKLRLGSWQKTDTERTDGGNGHEEMLVEGFAMSDTLSSLMQRFMSYQQIGH